MADIADQAQIQVDALTSNPKLRPAGPAVTGFCLNCGPDVPLPHPHRWCDAACRDDHLRTLQHDRR